LSSWEFRVEADVARVRFLRADIRAHLEQAGMAERDLDRLVLVVDEIVSNAIEHGAVYRRPDDVLELRLTVAADHVAVAFHDPSVPARTVAELARMLERCQSGVPPLESERGRGLYLIGDGLEDIEAAVAEGGVGLRLTGRLELERA
jgi:anti-sigma regulatory factor (Ser/Thr protein kinase)